MPQLPLKRQTGWLKSPKLCTDALVIVIGSMSLGIHVNVLPIKSCKYMDQFSSLHVNLISMIAFLNQSSCGNAVAAATA